MKERMQRFMAGRYGNDQLNQFIFIVAIISMVLEIITRQSLFYIDIGTADSRLCQSIFPEYQ